MVFVLATRNGGLLAFSSAAEAVSYCGEIGVRDAAWLFFADDGSPLEARVERQNQPGKAAASTGAFILQRAISGLWLQERLAQVKKVGGGGLTTVAELVEILKINRGKRAAPGVKRR